MKLGFLELNVEESLDFNINKIRTHLREEQCDLLVIPSRTCYSHIEINANNLNDALHLIKISDKKIRELSQEFNCGIVYGSLSFDGLAFNKSIKVVSDGQFVDEYHALHLKDEERKNFIKGIAIKVIKVKDIRIGIEVGFDLYFANITNRYASSNVDLLIMFDALKSDKTFDIAKVRAIESLTPTLIMNNRQDINNDSMLLDKYGECILSTTDQEAYKCLEFKLDNKKTLSFCHDFYKEMVSFLS